MKEGGGRVLMLVFQSVELVKKTILLLFSARGVLVKKTIKIL